MGKLKNLSMAVLTTFTLICTITAYGYEARDYLQKSANVDKLKECLVTNQKWVPYPPYSNREAWDNLLANSKGEYIKQGERFLKYEWKTARASDYLEFGRSGDRSVMEGRYGENRKALMALAAAELAEGKGRFLDQIINGCIVFCEMTSWAPAAHISQQKARGCFPDYREDIIDIIGGETASELAWIYYFFNKQFDKANPLISKRIFYELDKRVLSNFTKDLNWWWIASKGKDCGLINNWNPWCNSNVLICYLLLENDKEKLAKAVYKTMVSVDQFLNYVKKDGACEEGPNYWGAAAGAVFKYLELLETATNGNVSIFDNQQIRDMGEYIVYANIGDGWRINFADAHARSNSFNEMFIFRYGEKVKSSPMMSFAKNIAQKNNSKNFYDSNLSSLFQNIRIRKVMDSYSGEFKMPQLKWYADTQFCNMYDEENDIFFAAKGGFNDESHNHNDAGSFILFYKKCPIIIDVGVGTYCRQTFSSERYTLMTMRSLYHNLPLINGIEQKNGRKYKATNVKLDENNMTLSMNIEKAYPQNADVKSWHREFIFKDGSLKLTDSYSLNKISADTKINFMLPTKPEILANGNIIIVSKGNKIKLSFDAQKFTPSIEEIKLDDKPLTKIWGNSIFKLSFTPNNKALDDSFQITFSPLK